MPPLRLARATVVALPALLLSLAVSAPGQSVVHDLAGSDAEGRFGNALREAGDVDADGVPDLLVGAPTDSSAGFKGGALYVHSGADGSLIHAIQSGTAFTVFGGSAASLGDLDHDGHDDFLVGQSFARGSGQVHAFSGADASLLWTIPGPTFDDAFGTSLDAVGDIDRDGVVDFAVGATWDKETIWFAGAVRVYSGATGELLFDGFGDAGSDNLGNQVRAAGDVDDDGWPDVIAGAFGSSANGLNAGMARVYSGRDGSVLWTWLGPTADDEYGGAVDGAGDVNADGFDDLIIGAYFADPGGSGDGTGFAEVRSGRTGAVLHTWTGAAAGDWFGLDVAGVGDQDGDGHDDVLVGASNFDPGSGPTGGAILYSGATGAPLLFLEGDAAGDDFGLRLSPVGDLDGDGYLEFAVGAPRATTSVAQGGRARVFSYDGPKGPWAVLGGGLAGTTLPARLRGFGTLQGGQPAGFRVNGGPFLAQAYLLMGFGAANLPFKGGVLVPDPGPPRVLLATTTDATGSVDLATTWPVGVPSGFQTWTQCWFVDPAAPAGFSASNAVRATAP